jgi:ABC-type transport system involved in multi-copper enzyme maturation permease subunit
MITQIGRLAGGIGAVTTKELRGRMRGWRAFMSLTLYVALLAAFTVLIYFAARRGGIGSSGGSPFASAGVGQTIFEVLMVVQTILVVFLAPAFTSGAISLEREKQTLELLAATPVPTLAIVLGKLVSALAFVLVQILASVPLVAVVFVFGGVAPDDILRGYVVLLAAGFGFGCVGLALSSITRRTQAATVLTWLVVLALTLGSTTLFYLWHAISASNTNQAVNNVGMAVPTPGVDFSTGSTDSTGMTTTTPTESKVAEPPEWLVWLNPGVAMGDVVCGVTTNAYALECRGVDLVLGQDSTVFAQGGQMIQQGVVKGGAIINTQPGVAFPVGVSLVGPANAGGGVTMAIGGSGGGVAQNVDVTGFRDRFWPKMVVAWVVAGILLVGFSVLMVRPRRERRFSLRPRRPHLPRRARGAGATP